MQHSLFSIDQSADIIQLYIDVFSTSENQEEGRMLGELVTQLIDTTPADELIGCVSMDQNKLMGCIFFSRFQLPNQKKAYLLSPVAVATDTQGQGVGQQLINFGLAHLKELGTEIVVTYGDPAYYRQTGFQKIDATIIQPPYPLSQPIGWLAQGLGATTLKPIEGATQCVPAFCKPEVW